MIPILYAVIAICLCPIFAFLVLRFFQGEFHNNIDVIDYIASAALGLIGATLWPLVLIIGALAFLLMRVTRRVDELKRQHEDAHS